jgi:delta24-sterol reductase
MDTQIRTHKATVATLASQVAQFSASQTPFRIYHGSTLSTRASSRQRDQIIDVSALNHVLQVNKEQRFVKVEPNVPMDKLVEATMAQGLLPKVVMVSLRLFHSYTSFTYSQALL